MNRPIISIITVVFNAGMALEETIKSILNQENDSFEYLIIDGGSTDETIDVIKKYRDRISTWVSEPDKGIYDAMNKGIRLAKGKYICFINAGDLLSEIPINKVSKSTADLISFPVKLSNGNVFIPKVDFSLKIRNTLPHQGCYYKKTPELRYDTNFKVFSDFCLNQKMFKNKMVIEAFQDPIVAFHDMGGISHDKKYSKEIFKVVRQNFGLHYQLLSWVYFKKQGLKLRFNNIISKLI
ncbi:glycosyltransferase family 2 protein [Flavobacterium sp. GSP14]|uniref:glycosyltransferase family 2 protein n=1 Tax=Flavobacterium sp. GSP14 TaxID=3401734 RepID=UPI003AAA72B7